MKVIESSLKGLLEILPQVHMDARGSFHELFNQDTFKKQNLPHQFVQDNFSFSEKGTLRGLHFQKKFPQIKLVTCLYGDVIDIAVDLRQKSKTFGKYQAFNLSSSKRNLILIPEGFAHGFAVTSKTANVYYKCSDFYHPEDDYGVVWNDVDLSINWPLKNPKLSVKDQSLPSLVNLIKQNLVF